MSRTYKSPLREEQMEQTRERLLDTLTEILASDTTDEVTVALVAERAKVSVRTAYRYFPTRDALMDAFNAHQSKKLGTPLAHFALEELPDLAGRLFASFSENEQLFRAQRRSPAKQELRKRRKQDQVVAIRNALKKYAPHLDELKVKQIGAVLHHTFGSEAWLAMIDNWGLSTPEAVDAVRWALEGLIARLDNEKARKGKR